MSYPAGAERLVNRIISISIIVKTVHSYKANGTSSKLWLYQYYCIDAPPSHKGNILRKIYMGSRKECYVFFLTISENNTPQKQALCGLFIHHIIHTSMTNKTCGAVLEKLGRNRKRLSLHMDSSVLAGLQRFTYIR